MSVQAMMLSRELKEDVALLQQLETESVGKVMDMAVLQLREGPPNKKAFVEASEAVGVEPMELASTIEAVIQLLLETARLQLPEQDLRQSLEDLQLGEEKTEALLRACSEQAAHTRSLVQSIAPSLPAFKGLDWRLDVQMGSRCLRGQSSPMMTLQIHTEQAGQPHTQLCQAQLSDIEAMRAEIKAALQELSSNHTRRVTRLLR